MNWRPKNLECECEFGMTTWGVGITFTKVCSTHAGTDPVLLFNVCVEEGERVAEVERLIDSTFGLYTLSDDDKKNYEIAHADKVGVVAPDAIRRPGLKVSHSFDSKRDLVVDVVGATASEIIGLDTVVKNKAKDPTVTTKLDNVKING